MSYDALRPTDYLNCVKENAPHSLGLCHGVFGLVSSAITLWCTPVGWRNENEHLNRCGFRLSNSRPSFLSSSYQNDISFYRHSFFLFSFFLSSASFLSFRKSFFLSLFLSFFLSSHGNTELFLVNLFLLSFLSVFLSVLCVF